MNNQKKNKKMNIRKTNRMLRLMIIKTMSIYTTKIMHMQINSIKRKNILMKIVMTHKMIMILQMMIHIKNKNWMKTRKKLMVHLEL